MKRTLRRLLTRCRANAGFTLVELLLALTLFSLLSLALVGSLRFETSTWKRIVSHTEHRNHTLHVQGLIRQMIEETYPLFLSEPPGRRHVYFEGTKTALTLLTTGPMSLGNSGRMRVTFSLDQHRQRNDLILTSVPELNVPIDQTAITTKALIKNAEAVEFSYFGQPETDRIAGWHDHWTFEKKLPQLVKVEVRFFRDDARTWPDLVIKPRIYADVSCVYDQLTNRCRGR